MQKHLQPLRPKHLFLLHHFFQATIVSKTAMVSTNPQETGIIITSGLISLSCVSGVVSFDVLLTNVDCVVSDRTVTLLKNIKQKVNRYTWWWTYQMLIIPLTIFITLFVWLEPIPCSFRSVWGCCIWRCIYECWLCRIGQNRYIPEEL